MRPAPAIAPRWFADKLFRQAAFLSDAEGNALRRAALVRIDAAKLHAEILFLKVFTVDFVVQSIYVGEQKGYAVLDRFYDRVYAAHPDRINVVEMMPRFVLYTDSARGLRGTGGRTHDIGEEFAAFCEDFAPYENKPRLSRLGAAIHKSTARFVYKLAETHAVADV
jgi:hypothetical protein